MGVHDARGNATVEDIFLVCSSLCRLLGYLKVTQLLTCGLFDNLRVHLWISVSGLASFYTTVQYYSIMQSPKYVFDPQP